MVEFHSRAGIARDYPGGLRTMGASPVWGTLAGQPTDDSEMALVLVRLLTDANEFDEEQVANAYTFWRESDPFDVGGTIRRATDAMIHARQSGTSLSAGARAAANLQSEANGALMRQSPLALWGIQHTEESLNRLVREDTALTHPNRVWQDASAGFIVALSACIHEGLDGEATYQRACSWHRQYGASPSITSALSKARRQAPNCEQNQGHVLIAL